LCKWAKGQHCSYICFQATLQQYRTVLTYPGNKAYNDSRGLRDPNNLYSWKIGGEYTDGSNILGLVFFAGKKINYQTIVFIVKYIEQNIVVVLGITLATMGEKGKPLLEFFTCLSETMMKITTWVIYLAPVGVFFLIGGQILEMDDFGVVAGQVIPNNITSCFLSFFNFISCFSSWVFILPLSSLVLAFMDSLFSQSSSVSLLANSLSGNWMNE